MFSFCCSGMSTLAPKLVQHLSLVINMQCATGTIGLCSTQDIKILWLTRETGVLITATLTLWVWFNCSGANRITMLLSFMNLAHCCLRSYQFSCLYAHWKSCWIRDVYGLFLPKWATYPLPSRNTVCFIKSSIATLYLASRLTLKTPFWWALEELFAQVGEREICRQFSMHPWLFITAALPHGIRLSQKHRRPAWQEASLKMGKLCNLP